MVKHILRAVEHCGRLFKIDHPKHESFSLTRMYARGAFLSEEASRLGASKITSVTLRKHPIVYRVILSRSSRGNNISIETHSKGDKSKIHLDEAAMRKALQERGYQVKHEEHLGGSRSYYVSRGGRNIATIDVPASYWGTRLTIDRSNATDIITAFFTNRTRALLPSRERK